MSKNDEILVKVSHMTKKFGDLLGAERYLL